MPKMRWNTDATVIKRIKRANTDWWIREKAIVGDNGMTYIVYTTDTGEIHIRETDCRAPREPDRDFCLSRLNHDYSDEHNAPSLCILPDGRMIVAYAGHAAHGLSMRISTRPYDVYSFAPERTLDFDGSVTYAQMFYNAARGAVWTALHGSSAPRAMAVKRFPRRAPSYAQMPAGFITPISAAVSPRGATP